VWVIWILITVVIDIFRLHDLPGRTEALRFLFVLSTPLIGVLAYLIARGDLMHERAGAASAVGHAVRCYLQQAEASSPDQLIKLAGLRGRERSSLLRSSSASGTRSLPDRDSADLAVRAACRAACR